MSEESKGVYNGGWEFFIENDVLYGCMKSGKGSTEQTLSGARNKSYENFYSNRQISQMTVIGTCWIYGLKRIDDGKWEDGYIIDPRNGRRYRCKVTFHPADGKKYKTDILEVRGEIGLGIGVSQYWLPATKELAFSLK